MSSKLFTIQWRMTYRICSNCGKKKDESDFYLTGKITSTGRNIPRAKCKVCVQGVKKKRRENIRAWLKQYKRNSACVKCGYSKETHASFNLKALEFHHPQNNKEFNIADAASRGMALEKLQIEIDKCVLLCARCHIEIHSR